jgi:NHL repeat
MMRYLIAATGTFLFAGVAGALAAEPSFTARPTAKVVGAEVKISFAVSSATDATVVVTDAKGKAVRHLATGLLGPNAPAPFRKNSLTQAVVWDRRDDDGKPAGGGPFKVRVQLGLTAAFDRIIQGPGSGIEAPNALGTGPAGELYVLSTGSMWTPPRMYVLNREGKYLRTILPPPANLKRAQLKGLEPIKLADGTEVPVVYNAHSACLMPGLAGLYNQQLCVTRKGRIIFASGGRTNEERGAPRNVMAIKPDGSMPSDVGFVGPSLRDFSRAQLAVGPDGQDIYVVAGKYKRGTCHAVFRLGWKGKAGPELFVGKPAEAGSGKAGLNSPKTIAVDAKGNICVADTGNNRVAVFDPKGKFLGETRVPNPGWICLHPETGAMYVLSSAQPINIKGGSRPSARALVKYDKVLGGKEVARYDFKAYRYPPLLTLDASKAAARLWLSFAPRYGQPYLLLPIDDKGGKLVGGEDILKLKGAAAKRLSNPYFMCGVDAARGRAYVGDYRAKLRMVDLKTGTMSKAPVKGSDLALDRQGNLYVLPGYGSNAVLRFLPNGKPLPFAATGSNKIKVTYRAGHPNVGLYGLTVAPGGDIYVYQGRPGKKPKDPCRLSVFGADGKPKNDAVIRDIFSESATSVAVDRAGNIYAGLNVQDPGKLYPDGMGTEVYADKNDPRWKRSYMNFYIFHGGSVLKFPPEGGRFWAGTKRGGADRPADVPADAVEYRSAEYGKPERGVGIWCQGALWRYRGFSPNCHRPPRSGDPGCSCWSTGRFSLDESGRLFVPDVFRFSIGVLDANGNEIMRFGKYGNIDSAGPRSSIPTPDIPLAWPTGVAVAGNKAYVLDRINRRIVIVNLTYRTEELCSVVTGGAAGAEPKATAPLAGLPSKEGKHITKIKALGDHSWLDLGKPAADPKWGVARGRTWTPKMVLDSKRQAAFYSGSGVHGFVKPDGHYQDDVWAYDVNAHRWICLYPGANTKTLKLTLDKNGLEVNAKGEQVPVAFLGHGYNNMTFIPELDLYMILLSGDPFWKKAMPQRKEWGERKGWPPLYNPKHPIFYDIAKGKLTRKFVAGKGPGPKPFECVLEYIPSRKQVFGFHRLGRQLTTWFYDPRTNSWTLMKPKGKPTGLALDAVGCLDTKRDRVYIVKSNAFWYYDVKANAWVSWKSENVKNLPLLSGGRRVTMTYDSVNDVIVGGYYDRQRKKDGLYIYHPSINSWEKKPFAWKALPKHSHLRCRSAFYHPELNAHFFYNAWDSSTKGATMRVWRYKRAVKKEEE